MEQVLVKQIAKQLPKSFWADERKPEYGVVDGEQKLALAIVTTKTLDGNIMKVFFTDTKESALVEGGLEAAMELVGEHYANKAIMQLFLTSMDGMSQKLMQM